MSDASQLVGYTDRLTVRPGETIRFRVGAKTGDTPYSADFIRIRCADVSEDGPGFKEEEVESTAAKRYSAFVQRVDRSSRAIVPRVPVTQSLTLQVAIQPSLPGGRLQAIAGTWDAERQDGFALFLDEQRHPVFPSAKGAEPLPNFAATCRCDRDNGFDSPPAMTRKRVNFAWPARVLGNKVSSSSNRAEIGVAFKFTHQRGWKRDRRDTITACPRPTI